MPGAAGVQFTLKLAVPALISPLPLTPVTAVVHVEFVYRMKVTDPVGVAPPLRVAVSFTGVIATPAVPVCGAAIVAIAGDALPTVSGSLLQLLSVAALLASPENDACQ